MHTALALGDAPLTVSATSLDPYGQLIKMLLPRAESIVFHDRMGVCLWESDGADRPELAALMQDAHSGEIALQAPGDGFTERLPGGQAAYVFLLRDENRALIGVVGLVCRESHGESRPYSLIQALLRPALQCLQRELASQSSIGDLQRSLTVRDRDLELLLGATQDESSAADATDDFARLVQGCIDHLDCAVGALLIPDKNIAVCRTGGDTPASAGADVLTRTHRHLIGWTQLHRQTMTSNQPADSGPLANVRYKVLSCPVMHGAQRVLGVLVLFKPLSAPDFDLRQVRIVELLARRVAFILMNAYDPTTGLLTRPAFEKRAHALLAASSRGSHCVMYVDIDRLHVLNENLGMLAGDEVIVRVAEAIRRSVTPRMLASRISGDRFALLLPEASVDKAQDLAERLREALERLAYVRDRQTVEVTASFGIAPVVSGHHPLSHALASAEIACKAAKDRGRNRVEVYADGDQSIVRRYTDLTLVGTVRSALLDQRFRLEAQPIVSLGNGAPDHPKYELLLRMTDESGTSVPPDKFLSAAERYQLAPAIDRWVVRQVIATLKPHAATLQAQGACFAVNISGQSLGDADFALFMEGALRDAGLPLELLSFEVTETAAVANIVRAEALIRRWRELGCAVALDDFGRGLSSLTYLKTLPVTHLKIDGSFVRDVVADERSHAMLSAIVQLARAMKLETVAECVESDAIGLAIRRLGVSYGQGFSIGRPVPLDRVLATLVAANMGSREPLIAASK